MLLSYLNIRVEGLIGTTEFGYDSVALMILSDLLDR